MFLTPLGDTSPSRTLIPPEAATCRSGPTRSAGELTPTAAE